MDKLSVVAPVYYNEMNLPELFETLKKEVFFRITNWELIFVDDGSGDNSYEIIKKFAKEDSRVKGIKLSRNFGSHSAILAGLNEADGDCVTFISADLQDPPQIILQMFEKWKQGNKVVLAVREDREESFMQKAFAGAYYGAMRKFAIPSMPKGGFDCCLIDKKVKETICMMEEKNTTLMGQILWCGFKREMIYYTRKARKEGKSRWTLSKKIKLAIDSLLGFSYMPIRAVMIAGGIFSAAAIVWFIVIIVSKLSGNIDVPGYSALSVIMLLGFGLLFIFLGIIGEYLWRTFDASRKRPVYIIEEKTDDENNSF